MADYRLSAQLIKRSEGRSSVASSAYRAGVRMVDIRTGEIHNYEPRGGVVHTEILAPGQTPDWMLDRAELWNAVEKVERRKDAQLSREIQLSLPHELTTEQRTALVQGFAMEQFVERGMIADVAIHTPSKAGDERNHHAHIMLTMREVTADGFGNKVRAWNDREIIGVWREQWANHQNRALKHHGHKERVDHRSYAERGIDQEPTQHRGVSANEMEQRGEQTRIGDKNRATELRNANRAKLRAYEALISARLDYQRSTNDPYYKPAKILDLEDLKARQKREKTALRQSIQKEQKHDRHVLNSQLARVSHRLDNSRGIKKAVRHVLGLDRHDKALQQSLSKGLQALQHSAVYQIRRQEQHHAQELKNRLSPLPANQSTATPKQKKKFAKGWDREIKSDWGRATQPSNDNTKKRDGWNRFRGKDLTKGRKP